MASTSEDVAAYLVGRGLSVDQRRQCRLWYAEKNAEPRLLPLLAACCSVIDFPLVFSAL